MEAGSSFALDRTRARNLVLAVAFLGGILAWLVCVPLFGPAWLALSRTSHLLPIVPVYLFLGAHAIGLAAAGLASDVWPAFRRAGLLVAAGGCLLTTLITAVAPALALATFPLLGLLAAWGIVAWAPAFRTLAPPRSRALAFVGVPVAANAVKYVVSLGIGHLPSALLVALASLPLLGSVFCGPKVAAAAPSGGALLPDAPPNLNLRPLRLLAPFLFIVYLSAGVSYAAVTPSLLAVLRSPVDPSLVAYVLVIPLLALAGDRRGMRGVAVAGTILLGAAFLVWAALPSPDGALLAEVLMGSGYAAMDLFTWVALLHIAPLRGTATAFGIGLNVNVLPILIGAGLQSQVPWLAHLPPTTVAGGMLFLMLLAVVFLRETSVLGRAYGDAASAGNAPQTAKADAGPDKEAAKVRSSIPERLATIAAGSMSPRELEVACLAIEGRTVAQMARELMVSENTIKTHLASVYRKTGTHGRATLSAKMVARDEDRPGIN